MKVTSTKLGYDPHNVMAIRIPMKKDTDKNQQRRANYIEQLRERVASACRACYRLLSLRT